MPTKTKPAKVIFIDRDGVINVDPIGDYIKSWEEFRFEEGTIEGLKELSTKGYDIIVVSNQAGVGDGVYPETELWRIHENMVDLFRKEKIRFRAAYYCVHGKSAGCGCRKPAPGLFEKAAREFSFHPQLTFFVGDKVSDLEAGKRFGLKTIFVRTGHGKFEESKIPPHLKPDLICDSLKSAAALLPEAA